MVAALLPVWNDLQVDDVPMISYGKTETHHVISLLSEPTRCTLYTHLSWLENAIDSSDNVLLSVTTLWLNPFQKSNRS
jgi:hypothetical protein